MKLFFLGFVMVFVPSFFAKAGLAKKKTQSTNKVLMDNFSGEWTRTQGEKFVCPDKIIIQPDSSGNLILENIRPTASATLKYRSGTVLTKSEKRTYKAKSKKKKDHDYTLISDYNTSIVNGRLVSNHLWSGENESWSSTGTKVFSLPKKGTLTLEKTITAYLNKKEDNEYTQAEWKRLEHFNHPEGFGLRSAVFKCQFSRLHKVAQEN